MTSISRIMGGRQDLKFNRGGTLAVVERMEKWCQKSINKSLIFKNIAYFASILHTAYLAFIINSYL